MVIVLQIGARRHYAVPRLLHEEGLLTALYTDTCPGAGQLGNLGAFLPSRLLPKEFRRWLTRIPRGIPLEKIRTSETSLVWEILARKRLLNDHWDMNGPMFRSFEKSCLRHGLSDASIIYGMLFESSPKFLRHAKSRGLKIILDVYITPMWHRIVSNERKKFPHWEGESPILRHDFERRVEELLDVADILLCPGENVVDGLRQFHSFDEAKVRLLTYGCGIDFGGKVSSPIPGRVLFAGTADLRKGLPYLAQASSILHKRGKSYDFCVAGGIDTRIRSLSDCKHLNFLGRISRPSMNQVFLSADVLAFPTQAEGCAGVVHEALMAGLPVITTKASGSILRHGLGGLIVREGDPYSLADAIETVVENRELRNQFAFDTQQYQARLSEQTWGAGLSTIVHGLLHRTSR